MKYGVLLPFCKKKQDVTQTGAPSPGLKIIDAKFTVGTPSANLYIYRFSIELSIMLLLESLALEA